jgi:hypothetical protein
VLSARGCRVCQRWLIITDARVESGDRGGQTNDDGEAFIATMLKLGDALTGGAPPVNVKDPVEIPV